MIASTLTPYWVEMLLNVSCSFTTCVRCFLQLQSDDAFLSDPDFLPDSDFFGGVFSVPPFLSSDGESGCSVSPVPSSGADVSDGVLPSSDGGVFSSSGDDGSAGVFMD